MSLDTLNKFRLDRLTGQGRRNINILVGQAHFVENDPPPLPIEIVGTNLAKNVRDRSQSSNTFRRTSLVESDLIANILAFSVVYSVDQTQVFGYIIITIKDPESILP